MSSYYPYDLMCTQRADALAEILLDCVTLYLHEIAGDEPEDVKAEAVEALATKLQAGRCV